jgi:hypothetical protein
VFRRLRLQVKSANDRHEHTARREKKVTEIDTKNMIAVMAHERDGMVGFGISIRNTLRPPPQPQKLFYAFSLIVLPAACLFRFMLFPYDEVACCVVVAWAGSNCQCIRASIQNFELLKSSPNSYV